MLERPSKLVSYRFDQLADQINKRVMPDEADVERYVGLEHLDPDSLRIRRWGDPSEVESTKLRFEPGDIIFGKRRVYQRKVAVADTDGICSAHAMVLRAKPDTVLPDFLPFFMQSDLFMERALSISVGSLSPTINWKALAKEEFLLPPLQEQARILDLMTAIQANVDALIAQADATKLVFQSAVDDVFGRPAKLDGYQVASLKSLSQKIVDGVHHTPTYVREGVPFLTVENLTRGSGIDFSNTRFVSEVDHREFIKRAHPENGDVLISKDGTLGVSRVVETEVEFSIFVSVAMVKPKPEILDPWFLRFYFESSLFKRHIASRVSGSALKHIHLIDLRESPIPLLEIEEQRRASANLIQIYNAILLADDRVEKARAFHKHTLSGITEGIG